MAQYISKSALVAELKKRIRDYWSNSENTMGIYPYALEEVIKYTDTLEVKGVDLEEEIERVRKTHFINDDFEKATLEGRQITNIAKHFFELGMQVSNKTIK